MVILFPAIITVIYFFLSAKKHKENGVKWALTGLIGYILGVSIGMTAIGETFIAVFIGCVVIYLSHVQLLKSAAKKLKQ